MEGGTGLDTKRKRASTGHSRAGEGGMGTRIQKKSVKGRWVQRTNRRLRKVAYNRGACGPILCDVIAI